MAVLEGFLIGLGMVIFVGPVFFYLLNATVEGGFWAGFTVAVSIVIGDFIAIAICSLGAIPFFEKEENQMWLALIGGVLLFSMGLKYILQPKTKEAKLVKTSLKGYASYFVQGFLVNFVNPFVFLVWIATIGYAQTQFDTTSDTYLYLLFALVGIFTTDLTKVFFAHRIKDYITPLLMVKIYRVFGILLLLFGIRLLFHASTNINF